MMAVDTTKLRARIIGPRWRDPRYHQSMDADLRITIADMLDELDEARLELAAANSALAHRDKIIQNYEKHQTEVSRP